MKLRFTRKELEAIRGALSNSYRHDVPWPDALSAMEKVVAELAKDESAVALGSRKSARKAVSSAANGRKGGRPKKVRP